MDTRYFVSVQHESTFAAENEAELQNCLNWGMTEVPMGIYAVLKLAQAKGTSFREVWSTCQKASVMNKQTVLQHLDIEQVSLMFEHQQACVIRDHLLLPNYSDGVFTSPDGTQSRMVFSVNKHTRLLNGNVVLDMVYQDSINPEMTREFKYSVNPLSGYVDSNFSIPQHVPHCFQQLNHIPAFIYAFALAFVAPVAKEYCEGKFPATSTDSINAIDQVLCYEHKPES